MNELTILGSAAAEGVPGRFCNCPVCQRARANGGKDIRMTTSYSLNERVRIDYGPDAYCGELKFGLDSSKLQHLFFTHEHADHLDTYAFSMRTRGMSRDYFAPLNIYGRPTVWQRIFKDLGGKSAPQVASLKYVPVEHFRPIELPEEDMTFYPIPAKHYHIPGEAVFYVIRHGGSWLMIANDSSFPLGSFWQWLAEKQLRFDVVILDCTFCQTYRDSSHMGGECDLRVFDQLRRLKAVDDRSRLAVNHFTHNANCIHSELEAFFGPHGVAVCFDGMKIPYGG